MVSETNLILYKDPHGLTGLLLIYNIPILYKYLITTSMCEYR